MKPFFIGIGALALLAITAVGAAAESSEDTDRTLSPYFFVEGGDENLDRLPLKATQADVEISGVIADVVVTQVYRNEGVRPIHARYIFPASTRAAVHGMTLQVGEHRIRAQIREKEQARQDFEVAAASGKSAALLEQQRPNVFSMNVANVMPGDEIRVELHYSEFLIPTDGTYEFVYPAVVGPRYSNEPAADAKPTDAWVQTPYLPEGEAPSYAFDIHTRVAAGMPLQELVCTTHATIVDWEDQLTALVRLDASESAGGDRDFILRYRLEDDQIETGVLLYAGADENFFLLMMQPPQRVTTAQIPPREYIFVIDVSGSMYGFPLETTKSLMRELVQTLRPTDRFNMLFFSGGSALLAPESLLATEENLATAIVALDAQQGGGGTELSAALKRVLALPETKGMSRSTVVVTDGYIAAEPEAFDLIRNNLDRSNVFAFGIGTAVNRYLIEGIAAVGQGEPFIVTNPGDAPAVADAFREYIQSPLLTDIEVAFDGFEAYDIEPPSIPDLFASRPLVIFGKWRGEPTGSVRISGMTGNGLFEDEIDIAEARPADEHAALQYLWARTRVARLSDFGPSHNDEIRQKVTALGLTYDLLTAYTSFIAVHEVVRNHDGAEPVDQPLPLPQGVSALAVGSAVPEPELALLAFLLLATALWRRRLPPLQKGD